MRPLGECSETQRRRTIRISRADTFTSQVSALRHGEDSLNMEHLHTPMHILSRLFKHMIKAFASPFYVFVSSSSSSPKNKT